VVPVRMKRYMEVSEQLMEALRSFSPLIEPLSLDEAFLDMTGCERLFGSAQDIARGIKARVLAKTSLTCSVGIAVNKFLAKIGSDFHKPDGITIIEPGQERAFLEPLPVRKLWGVGPRTAERLEQVRLYTIGAIAAANAIWLKRELGSLAEHLQSLARGEDEREVEPDRERKSVGAETTMETDVTGKSLVAKILRAQCQRAARQLRAENLSARGVRVKLRYSRDFQLTTRDCRMPMPVDDSASLYRSAEALLDRLDLDAPIRLVGVAAFDLVGGGQPAQQDLFAHKSARKNSKLEHVLDEIRARFPDKIKRGEEVDED
jgi:DNA polymerase IV